MAKPEVGSTDVDRRLTPLHVAVDHDNEEMATLLIELGADVEKEQIPDGQSALHVASRHGSSSMIRVLLAAGANVNKSATVDGLIQVVGLIRYISEWVRNKLIQVYVKPLSGVV